MRDILLKSFIIICALAVAAIGGPIVIFLMLAFIFLMLALMTILWVFGVPLTITIKHGDGSTTIHKQRWLTTTEVHTPVDKKSNENNE